jgi:PAS domain S-box-containing protein
MLLRNIDAVLESSYDGIYITDGQANTLRINKSYERITGISREKMLGRNMKRLVEDGIISSSATLTVIETGNVTTMQQEFASGKKALVTSTPVYDEDGNITMVVTNVRDITELDKLKEELEKKEILAQKYYSEIEDIRARLVDTEDIVAEDKEMLQVIFLAKRIASVDTTVLLLGETGVGKEELAKYIHKNSLRNKKQFIKINCGAIPESLIESELFGYEKGSFTGANKEGKQGIFELADGGTLFLDEVGELPLNIQVKLLRVLQESEVMRIGGIKPVRINVRILAATHRNLEEMIKNNTFREDLYYRLNVVPLVIPPLRERRKDIIPLVKYFLLGLNQKYSLNKYFNGEALDAIYNYDWHGNVRELKNIVERVVILSNGEAITKGDLPQKIREYETSCGFRKEDRIMELRQAVAEVEMKLIDSAYKKYGNVRDAAKALGIDAATFVRKRKKYNK